VSLILLGLTVLVSRQFTYRKTETIAHTQLKVRRVKIIVVPRAIAALIISSGVLALVSTLRSPR
jgi:hypothetical protein